MLFGNGFSGKMDEVPGLFHVATRFVHVCFIPIIPLESRLVDDREPEPALQFRRICFIVLATVASMAVFPRSSSQSPLTSFQVLAAVVLLVIGYRVFTEKTPPGVPIPANDRSVYLAWFRTVAIFLAAMLLPTISGWASIGYPNWWFLIPSVGGCVIAPLLIWGPAFRRPTYERAKELAGLLALGPEDLIQIELLYGRINPSEAELQLDQVRSRAAEGREQEVTDRREDLRETVDIGTTQPDTPPPIMGNQVRCQRCDLPVPAQRDVWVIAGYCSWKCSKLHRRGPAPF